MAFETIGAGTKKIDAETEFLKGLIELQYGQNVEEKLRKLSCSVPWTKGWPEDKESFWNAEAFMWRSKIKKEKRELLKEELKPLAEGKNLDLGCGAYSYVPSIGFDVSQKMLDFNDNCIGKVKGDLEAPLPFADKSFDSVTAVFVFNYINNYMSLLQEACRVMKDNGIFVMVLSSRKINEWQRKKEANSFGFAGWGKILDGAGFNKESYRKENLWFFKGKKQKTY